MRRADVAQSQIDLLEPYFNELKQAIHIAWENLAPGDEEEAKLYKHQIYAINKLMQIMKVKVNKGKQARHQLGEHHVNH